MRKITTVIGIMLILVILPVFAGGGGQKSSAPAGRIEVSYMGWGNEVEQQTVQTTLESFNASQDRVWATYIPTPENYNTKINTMAASNSLPDAGMLNEKDVLRWAANGMLLDVADLFPSQEEQPIQAVTYVYEGKPVAYSLAEETMLLYYNRDIFDKVGLPYPPARAEDAWTWEQFVDVAKKLTKDTTGKTPYDAGFNPENIVSYGAQFYYNARFWPVMGKSNGGGWFSDDKKTLLINSPETVEAAQAIANLYFKDHVAPNPATGLGDQAIAMLSGQVAMSVNGQWAIGLNYLNATKEGLNYGVGVLPKFKKAVTTNTGGPAVIFKTTKYPAEAKEMLRQFYDPQKNLLFIQTGIWQPIRMSWYNNEQHIRTWADHPNRPPLEEYRNAVINYTLNNLEQAPNFYFAGWSEFEDLLVPAMDPVWQGDKTAKEALDAVYPALLEIVNKYR